MLFRVLALVALLICRWRFPAGVSIAVILRRRYGPTALRLFRATQTTDYKIRKIRCDLQFLESCERFGLTPKFLHFKLYNRCLHRTRHYRDYQKRLLSEEIRTKHRYLKQATDKLNILTIDLKSTVSHLDFIHLSNCIERVNLSSIEKVKHVHSLKLSRLGFIDDCIPADKVIFNYSSRQLSETEKSLLAKGLDFAFVSNKLHFDSHFLTFEGLFRALQPHSFYTNNPNGFSYEYFKSTLRHLAMSSYYQYKPEEKFMLSKSEYEALVGLSKDDSIVILKPDKGNGTVIMDKTEYQEKINTILGDPSKFLKVDKDPYKSNINLEDKVNRILHKLHKSGSISKGIMQSLQASGSTPGLLYGLPKVHKEGHPLRPILSAIGTANYNIAKYLVPILSPLTINEHTIKDSFHFISCLKDLNFANCTIASFDVKSLFTQIPLDETIDICMQELFKDDDEVYGLNRPQFKELLSLATKECYFLFNNCLYKQIDGVSMGSSLGPSLANIFMCYMESTWLSNCPPDFKPLLYKRYVDDTFLVFKTRDQIPLFLEYLNSRHMNIEFTVEIEKERKLPFLDIEVHNLGDKFTTSVYRKPTFTGLMSKFCSASPVKYKRNLIITLVTRAYKICSSYFDLHRELEFLKSLLKKNGYPLNFIETYIGQRLSKLHLTVASTPSENIKRPILYVPLTFTGRCSNKIKKQLSKLLSDTYPQLDVKIYFRLQNKIRNFFRIKDKIPTNLRSKLIYLWKCRGCEATYIGRTTRSAWTRWFEHLGRSFRTGSYLT